MNISISPGNRKGRNALWMQFGLILLLGYATVASSHAAGGSVEGWGNNNDLQVQVPSGLTNVVAVAGGRLHSLALKTDGTVVGWGFNLFGQANVPAGLNDVVAIAARYSESIALKSDGTVLAWGQTPAPAGLTNVVAVTAGWNHSLALREDGSLVAWGAQTEVPSGLTGVRAIASGHGHNLALRANGTVFAWGDDSFGKTAVPPGLTNVVAIAAGKDHSLALRSDGTVVAWGDDSRGQASVPAGLAGIVAISAGAQHSLALRANGTVTAWGDNTFNQSQPGSGGDFFAIAAGGYHNLAVRGAGVPIILLQPADQTVNLGDDAIFRVSAVGLQPLSFQWQHDGEDILGAVDSVLMLQDVQESDAGAYSVRVSNTVGSVTSAEAVLTLIDEPPIVVAQPQDKTVVCGDNVQFDVVVTGRQPFTYEWWYGGEIVSIESILLLSNVIEADAGEYFVVISNENGSVTSEVAQLEIVAVPPTITSPPAAAGRQGEEFFYAITAAPVATAFEAILPPGLEVDPVTGVISGVPEQIGTFGARITAITPCDSRTETLAITIDPAAVPQITSPLTAEGAEGEPFTYQIEATESPIRFDAENLPAGLVLNQVTGLISGRPVYAGDFSSTISAGTDWAATSATLEFSFAPATITALSIVDVTYHYLSPYLLEFEFSLRGDFLGANGDPGNGDPGNGDPGNGDPGNGDPGNGSMDNGGFIMGNAVVVDPSLFTIVCKEDDQPISPTEAGVFMTRTATQQITSTQSKIYLVLDFTESVATLEHGDTNEDGISDAVDAMVEGAEIFVDRQQPGTLIGVYVFHREDMDPQQVIELTDDKELVKDAIGGIWEDYVQGFPAGSRCWDALLAAINALGQPEPGERHYVVFMSDGADESSVATVNDVTAAALVNQVRVYPIGFGNELVPGPLQAIAAATEGIYIEATSVEELVTAFDYISKDLADARYTLRWATLQRMGEFTPSFDVTYQGITASSPPPREVILDDTYALLLMPVEDATPEEDPLPAEGSRLIIIGVEGAFGTIDPGNGDNGDPDVSQVSLYFRIFDETGLRVVDAVEAGLPDRAGEIEALKFILADVWGGDISPEQHSDIVDAVAAIFAPIMVYIIPPYSPGDYAGPVTVGLLLLVVDEDLWPNSVMLRASYVPRQIRRIRIHYRANWPHEVTLESNGPGEILQGWSLTETDDEEGGKWLHLVSPNPQITSLPFASFGNLLRFSFRDLADASTAFSFFEIDNSVYELGGGQSFVVVGADDFVEEFPVLPFGTPVPWLIAHGITEDFEEAEISDLDGDGMPMWKEYLANTDPTDPESRFFVRSVSLDFFGRNEITFTTALDRTYRVESSTDLDNWEIILDNVAGTGADITVTDLRYIPDVPNLFYRVAAY